MEIQEPDQHTKQLLIIKAHRSYGPNILKEKNWVSHQNEIFAIYKS